MTSTHSVQFDSSNVDFDVVALSDLSHTMSDTFSFRDIFYQRGFDASDSDATATIDISASAFSGLFKLNFPIGDPSSNLNVDRVRYLVKDVWGSSSSDDLYVPFSSATVTENMILAASGDQSLKRDFLRSMILDITGTTRLNNLFKNQATMADNVAGLDASFNASVKNVFKTIADAGWLTDDNYGAYNDSSRNFTFVEVFGNATVGTGDDSEDVSGQTALKQSAFSSFNPLRILSSTILGEGDASDGDSYDISGAGLGNDSRRTILMNSLKTQANAHWEAVDGSSIAIQDSAGLWYTAYTTSQSGVAENEVQGEDFSQYLVGIKLYTTSGTGAASKPTTDYDLIDVINHEYDLDFIAGDVMNIVLDYVPYEGADGDYAAMVGTQTMNNRKYLVKLNMV